MYDFIVTEGELRHILTVIKQERRADGRPSCLQIHIEPGNGNLQAVRNTVEPLSQEMLAEMQAKGQLELGEQ